MFDNVSKVQEFAAKPQVSLGTGAATGGYTIWLADIAEVMHQLGIIAAALLAMLSLANFIYVKLFKKK